MQQDFSYPLPQARSDALRRRNAGRAVVVSVLIVCWGAAGVVTLVESYAGHRFTTENLAALAILLLIPLVIIAVNFQQSRLVRGRIPSQLGLSELEARLEFEDRTSEARPWSSPGPALTLIRTRQRTDGRPGNYVQIGASNWVYVDPPTFEAVSKAAETFGRRAATRSGPGTGWVLECTVYEGRQEGDSGSHL